MGSTPSRATQTDHTRNEPNTLSYHTNQSPTQPSQPHHHSVATRQKRHQSDELEWAQAAQPKRHAGDDLRWPLPPDEYYAPFELNDNSESDRFALTPISPRRTTPSPPSTPGRAVELYNEKDTSNEEWKKQTDSKLAGSAHVQSQLSSRFHACFNLSASDNVNVVMSNLKKIQLDLDDRLKRRLAKLSAEVEQKIGLVVDDTKAEQKRLLAYDKQRQLRQDELYQEWLHKYIVELNTWRSKKLADLQGELKQSQDEIVRLSKKKIDRINQEAYLYKTQLLDEEKMIISKKTDKITNTIFDLNRQNGQFLGSESKTEINLRIQANVGQMAPGQGCTNVLDD